MTNDQLVELRQYQRDALLEYWHSNTFLQWEWWLLFLLAIIPWIIWWKLADKERIFEILTFGFFMAILTAVLDNIGTNMVWWTYPNELLPILPPLVPVDYSIVPCSMMVVFQYFKNWKTYLLANMVLALFSTYVGEKIFESYELFERITWKPLYSILFYLVACILGKLLINSLTLSRNSLFETVQE